MAGHAIFISYRRDDSGGEAGRLFDDLTRAFSADAVFMDVSGIEPGIDFRKAIDQNVSCCGVLLAVIGPSWATIAGSNGERRLDNESDYVRLEISAALSRNIAVIPVLVHGARMPHADQLPENLKDLAYRNSVELTLARWNSDVQLLIQALAQYVHVHAAKASETEPVHAVVPVQLPAPHAEMEAAPVQTKPRKPLKIALFSLSAVVTAVIAFFAYVTLHHVHGSPSHPDSPTSPLVGRWTNPSASEHGAISELDITGGSNQLAMHAWAVCRPTNCDWGTQNASYDGKKAKATWSLLNDTNGQEQGRVATLTISSASNGKLDVLIQNTYAKHAGNSKEFEFVAAH